MECCAGVARGKAEGKQASAKAQPKPAPGKAQKAEQPKQAAGPSKESVNGEAVQRGPDKVTSAFGNVLRSPAPDAPQSSTRSEAQQLLPPGKAPPLAPASEVNLLLHPAQLFLRSHLEEMCFMLLYMIIVAHCL